MSVMKTELVDNFSYSHQDHGSTVLDVVELLDGSTRDPCEEPVA